MSKTRMIYVTDTFRVEAETYFNNFQPQHYRAVVKKKKGQGEEEKFEWVKHQRFFKNMSQAIHYGIEQGWVELDTPYGDDMSLNEYIQYLNDVQDKTQELLSRMG